MADDGQTIIDLDKKRMLAMAAKDFATLNAVLADDLIYTHSSARLDTKKSLIGNMQSAATVYTSVEPSEVKAQDLGDAVVLTGIAQIKVMSNGTPNAFGVRFTDVDARRNGRWQMVTCAESFGIEPKFQICDVRSGAAVTRIISGNLRRRHDDPGVRAMQIAELLEMLKAENFPPPTVKEAAEAGGVSDRTVRTAKTLRKKIRT